MPTSPRLVLLLLSILVIADTTSPPGAAAEPRPMAAARIVLREGQTDDARRFLAASERRSSVIDVATIGDPRILGATLEVVGTGAAGAATERIALPPQHWRGIGRPAGSRGYRYSDPDRTHGIRRVSILGRRGFGRLLVHASGRDWAYPLSGEQEQLNVHLHIGSRNYCMAVDEPSFSRNGPERVIGRDAPAPATCTPAGCGDGRRDVGEECDDGNVDFGDACSPTCRLVDVEDPCFGIAPVAGAALRLEPIATGLSRPVQVVAPPGDPSRLFIVEQTGRIRIRRNDALLPEPFLDLREDVRCCGEQGLLSLAFDPDYERNRRFFVNYTADDGATVIARFRATSDDLADRGSEVVLLRIPQDFANHNGGLNLFGPDGFLYVGMGDGGAGGDPFDRAQDPNSLLGKMLRIDVDVDDPPYFRVPADNPFAGEGEPRSLVWADGLRNPWRFDFDPATGALFIADVGQNEWEEINYQPDDSVGGENYGWDVFEGTACFEPRPLLPACPTEPHAFVPPIEEYFHRVHDGTFDCSVTGGHVYRGCRMPDLHGQYLYGDFCSGFVRSFAVVDGEAVDRRDHTDTLRRDGIMSFGRDHAGEIYMVTLSGDVYRIAPASF